MNSTDIKRAIKDMHKQDVLGRRNTPRRNWNNRNISDGSSQQEDSSRSSSSMSNISALQTSNGSLDNQLANTSTHSYSSQEELNDGEVNLNIGNLPSIDPRFARRKLHEMFSKVVPVVRCSVRQAAFALLATVTVRNSSDATLAIRELHRRKPKNGWCTRRIEITLNSKPVDCNTLRARLRRLRCVLGEQPVTLEKLCDFYVGRHVSMLTREELESVPDTVTIFEANGETMIRIGGSADGEQDWWRCLIHAPMTVRIQFEQILMPVHIELAILSERTYKLLHMHNGLLPLFSFVKCYEGSFGAIPTDKENGVVLELLLRSVPGVAVKNEPEKHMLWASDCEQRQIQPKHPDFLKKIEDFEEDLVKLLSKKKRCSIKFSEFIPTYHHTYWRQCRVAEYGFTRLPDLLGAVSQTVFVLGSGVWRVITLTPAAQVRHWNENLAVLLHTQPEKKVHIEDLPYVYKQVWDVAFQPADYGVCTVTELLAYTSPETALIQNDGYIILTERMTLTEQPFDAANFAEVVGNILRAEPSLQIPLPRFVNLYRTRISNRYDHAQLHDLLALIPQTAVVVAKDSARGHNIIRLASSIASAELANRVRAFVPIQLETLANVYESRYGTTLPLRVVKARNLDEAMWMCGYTIEHGTVRAADGAWASWARVAIELADLMSSDRCIAPGSNREWVEAEFIRRTGGAMLPLRLMTLTGVVVYTERELRLTPVWRELSRLLQMKRPIEQLTVHQLASLYLNRYCQQFPHAELGFDSLLSFLRHFPEVFVENTAGLFCVPLSLLPLNAPKVDTSEYDLLNTPPGGQSSRVFQSPVVSLLPRPDQLLRRSLFQDIYQHPYQNNIDEELHRLFF